MLLATDLDGTFLAGDAESRLRLYQTIVSHPEIQLAYVSGRSLERILPLLDDPTVPTPDYIIADVGATVVRGDTLEPIESIQWEVIERWPGESAVAEAMSAFPALERQEVAQARRASYYCSPEQANDPKLHEVAKSLGCDLLYSADRYLDLLPAGVNKGSTLSRLVDFLQLDPEQVMVAGDTLNDISMFEAGFKGVCVAGSEQALLDQTHQQARVLHARETGCGGIAQALAHFGFLGIHGQLAETQRKMPAGGAELVVVYHRLPYEEYRENGKLMRRRPTSPNGIIPTLLGLFADGRKGSWVAWAVREEGDQDEFETHTTVDARRYPNLTASRVALTKEEVDIFYKRFSKEAFWPTLHTFWERARFREDDWQVFLRVNRAFAERTAREAGPGAIVWIHDYNLWMVPAYLRELRPDVRIAFFHHTYFPSADVFNVVPWRRAIIASLLQCDYVGFHIPRQVENFVDVARGVMPFRTLERHNCAPRFLTYGCAVGLDRMTTVIETDTRRVHLGAHPVGLDVDRVRRSLGQPAVQAQIEKLRGELADTRVILSVERLDYTKGTLEKLLAFEMLLAENPDLRGKVSLVCVCVPAAGEMTIYDELRTQIEQVVGRVNGRFAQVGWMPLQFFFRSLPFNEVVAWYARADIMWITPLRDGLNLVAKEFVAVQGLLNERRGVLVLSEFAGAAAELKGALLTNPHDVHDLVRGCLQALNMTEAEAAARLRELFDIVTYNDIRRWSAEFLDSVNTATPAPTPAVQPPAELTSS